MIIAIALSLFYILFFGWTHVVLSKLKRRNSKVYGFLTEKFKDGYTIDKTVSAKGFQSLVVRLYADNKYWELDIDEDKGIIQEKILINPN